MKKTPIKVLSTISIIGLSTITLGQYHDAQAATGEKPQIKAPEQQVQYGKKWNPYENVTATDKLMKRTYIVSPFLSLEKYVNLLSFSFCYIIHMI